MKKPLLFFVAVLLWLGSALAQSNTAAILRNQPNTPCDIVVTGDFDSECIYDYKDDAVDEFPNYLVACKNSQVTYTAHANTGTATITAYRWEIDGDVSHTVSGSQVTVNWSGNDFGTLVVTVVKSDGDSCTAAYRVRLIDIPNVSATSVPPYLLISGYNTIEVCIGGSVQFYDNSDAGNSDIAGYYWSDGTHTATTPNFLVENITSSMTITHRVYNNCGCYDEEIFKIKKKQGAPLTLDCYGSVCLGDTVTYHATSPFCSDYTWYVEGGTLLSGQGTASPTVLWDNPSNGYGVIGLDGSLCYGDACEAFLAKSVPVIHGGLAIGGQTVLCAGEAVTYRLPLFGSTRYDWTITPTNGVTIVNENHANEVLVIFNQPGNFSLSCSYSCDFLQCGPMDAEPLAITVKPPLTIEGNDQTCITNSLTLSLTPSVNAVWNVTDLASGEPLTYTSGSTLSYTFPHAGRYLVTASNSYYCSGAAKVIDVRPTPPAPTVNDLNPANRHTACLGQGILLSGTPSEPNYSLVWSPVCNTASPLQYSGDSVTISYPTDVCDVRVYNYDRVLQCMSADYYLHTVTQLTPAQVSLPPDTVCPNSIITITDSQVPDQSHEGMLYEWNIQENKQYCASVQGSHLNNTATILCNNLTSLPETFYMTLKRSYCNGASVTDTLRITILNNQNVLSITGPDTVCLHSTATYTGSGDASLFWNIDGSAYSGSTATHTFDNGGNRTVRLFSNNPHVCSDQTKNVYVRPLPAVLGLTYDGFVVSVAPAMGSGYSYQWQLTPDGSQTPVNIGTGSSVAYSQAGTYCCTVTNTATGCQRTVCNHFGGTPDGCTDMNLTHTNYNYCNRTIQITSPLSINNVTWQVSNGASLVTSGTNNSVAEVTVSELGYVTVTAFTTDANNNCVKGSYSFLVDFIPDFTFEKNCTSVRIINNSQYLDGTQTVFIRCIPQFGLQATISLNVATPITMFYPLTGGVYYDFYLTGYGSSNGNITSCPLGSVFVQKPTTTQPLSISTSNPYNNDQTCNNTPIELSATLNGTPVSPIEWSFGDNSSATGNTNSIFHTFGYGFMNYTISAQYTDNNNCHYNASITITSNSNNIKNSILSAGNYTPHCPYGTPTNITFTSNATDNHYTWSNDPVNGPNPHPTYHSGDYFVYVMNEHYCQKEASVYVEFLNAPTAFIFADKFSVCLGETLKLYGDQGPSSNPMGYTWTPTVNLSSTSTPNVEFSSNTAGSFLVSLTVKDLSTPYQCSSYVVEPITVVPRPAAPTLAISGSVCNVPINVGATGYTGDMHWSTGETGAIGHYYSHGMVSAYYYDPTLACASERAEIRLPKRPDFNALLTGCYKRCQSFFNYNLPVYGLIDDYQSIGWEWFRNNTSIANGTYNNFYVPLDLLLSNYGQYNLDITFGAAPNTCTQTSPTLTLEEAPKCSCDSVAITYFIKPETGCQPVMDYTVTICNNSTNTVCFKRMVPRYNNGNYATVYNNFAPNTPITPGNCYSFHLGLQVLSLDPSVAVFDFIDSLCSDCISSLTLNLMPEINCEFLGYNYHISFRPGMSNDNFVYYDFEFLSSDILSVLTMWSTPPDIVNYSHTFPKIYGIGRFSIATLLDSVETGGQLCIYAIVCTKTGLCKLTFCRPAKWWHEQLMRRSILETPDDYVFEYPDETETSDDGPAMYARPNSSSMANPQLSPNPATDKVTIVNASDGKPLKHKISEVQIMDMTGRLVVTYSDTHCFNVAKLPSGSYIVRITATDSDGNSEIHYRKLVKK